MNSTNDLGETSVSAPESRGTAGSIGLDIETINDDALADHAINAAEMRLDGEYVIGGKLEFGMRILSGEASNEGYQEVVESTESDVEPLFVLHDAVSAMRGS